MKHAYLILAHNGFEMVKEQISFFDSEKNDIYIHIDKKSGNINEKEFKNSANKSNIFFVDRVSCYWGDYSLVQAELNLLESAYKKGYDYYHLLSGVDFPIKELSKIENFFEKNNGKNFISFCDDSEALNCLSRIKYKYLMGGCSEKKKIFLWDKIKKNIYLKLQKILHIERKIDFELKYGSQWFSIKNSLVEKILTNKGWIYERFNNTFCPDEHFLQSFIFAYNLEKSLYNISGRLNKKCNMREIDWERGDGSHPYVFKREDFKDLIKSDFLFARKIDSKEDMVYLKNILNPQNKL